VLLLTLVLAALGFALLVLALTTGSVVWAWGCIIACVIGAMVLLASALSNRGDSSVDDLSADGATRSSGATHRRQQ